MQQILPQPAGLYLIKKNPNCNGRKDEIAAIFTIHCFCVPAGLCDINEGTMVPEDRCKSPTSGNHHLL